MATPLRIGLGDSGAMIPELVVKAEWAEQAGNRNTGRAGISYRVQGLGRHASRAHLEQVCPVPGWRGEEEACIVSSGVSHSLGVRGGEEDCSASVSRCYEIRRARRLEKGQPGVGNPRKPRRTREVHGLCEAVSILPLPPSPPSGEPAPCPMAPGHSHRAKQTKQDSKQPWPWTLPHSS